MASKHFTAEDAKKVGEKLGIKWDKFDVEQFRMGLDVELEHGSRDPETDVTHSDPVLTGKIALAHLKEFPDYYTRLAKMEKEADKSGKRSDVMLIHTVLLKIKKGTSEKDLIALKRNILDMKTKIPGIKSVSAGQNNSLENKNKGYNYGFIVSFEKIIARDKYLTHPEHQKVSKENILPIIDDFLVFDYESD